MIAQILHFAIRQRFLVVLLTVGIAALGLWNFSRLPIDAVPDLTNVQVQINTSVTGLSPVEIEQRVTFPIESAMVGLPGVEQVAASSQTQQVWVVYDPAQVSAEQLRAKLEQAGFASSPTGGSA